MAIGTVTHVAHVGEAGRAPFVDIVSFPGPAAAAGGYTTGGDTGLLAALKAATHANRAIIAAVCMSAGGYIAEYIVATDLLKVWGTGAAPQAVASEIAAATALDGITFRMLVVSQ